MLSALLTAGADLCQTLIRAEDKGYLVWEIEIPYEENQDVNLIKKVSVDATLGSS